jgi:hypothetical protein
MLTTDVIFTLENERTIFFGDVNQRKNKKGQRGRISTE